MTQFKFKRHAAQYKNAKGDRTTISNGNLTDEKAIEFLRTNPARISLFAVYPSNWETILIDGAKKETPKQLKARLAIEAELQAANEAAADKEAKAKAAAAGTTSPEAAAGTSEKTSPEAGNEAEGNLDETEEEKEARLAAEAAEKEAAKAAASAEAEAAAAAGEAAAAALAAGTTGTSSPDDVQDLSRLSLKELRAKYPEIKATSIKDFIDKIKA